ncbi:hypothetical protein ACQ4PT_019061 [Festuca glaucescens]
MALPAPSPPNSPAATPTSPTAPAPPSPSTLVRLSPHAPGFLSDEQRRLLRGSALVSGADLDRAPTPPSTSPTRTLHRQASLAEEVPDSAVGSPSLALVGAHLQDLSPGLTGVSAINSPCRPVFNTTHLHSIVVASPSYLQGLHGTSSPPAAPPSRDEEGWVSASPRRRTRRDGHSKPLDGKATAPPAAQRLAQAEAAALRFKRRTEGLCARCLAPAHHHLASACRDKVRCLSCNLSGHKERSCPLRQAARAAKRKTPTAPLPRPQASSPTAPGARSWAAIVAATTPAPLSSPSPAPPTPSPTLLLPPPPAMALSGIGSAATHPEEDSVIIATSFEMDQDIKDWEATAAIAWVVYGNRKIEAKAVDRAVRKEFSLSHRDINVCPHQPVQFLLKFEHKAHCSEVLKRGRFKADNALLQLRPWRPLEHAFGAAMSFRVRLCLEGVPAYGLTSYVAERIIARRCSFDRLDDSSALMTNARSLDCWAWTANPSSIPKVVWLTFTSRGAGGLASEVFVHEVRPTGSKRGATFRVLVHLDLMEDYSSAPLDFIGSSPDAAAFKPTPVAFDWHYLTIDGRPPTPMQHEEDDETLARAAALARRNRGAPKDDHPRHRTRRDDHDEDRDREGVARRDRRIYGDRHDALGPVRRERTRSPRRRDHDDGGHGRKHAAGSLAVLHLAVPAPTAASDADLHAFIAEQGATLRADLLACLNEAVAPVLAESAVLRAWQLRALAFLNKAGVTASPLRAPTPLHCPREGDGHSPASAGYPGHHNHAGTRDATPATPVMDQHGLGSPAAGPSVHPPSTGASDDHLQHATGLLAQLALEEENEAWNAGSTPTTLVHDLPSPQSPVASVEGAVAATPPPSQPHAPPSPRPDLTVEVQPLQAFLASVAGPVQQPLLVTPPTRNKKKAVAAVASSSRSGRIAVKKKARQLSDGAVAIQELIAKVCGLLDPAATFDEASQAAYHQLFLKAPLASAAIQALEALVKHVKKIKKKGPGLPKDKPVLDVPHV